MSLQETYQAKKNLIAYNLTQKGVQASGAEGLTSLANKILDISGGGGVPCYKVEFTSNSWTYTDWDWVTSNHYTELEIYLQYQYEPYSGTVTLTDGTNTWNVTTNSSGIGKLTVKNISANSTTFTATYTNTTATSVVKKSTFHLIDTCSTDNVSTNYDASVVTYKGNSGSPSCELSYDSGMGCYKIVSTNSSTSHYSMIPIKATYDKTNYVAEVKIYDNKKASNSECGLFVKDRTSTSTSTYGVGADMNDYANKFYIRRQSQAGTSTSVTTNPSETLAQQTWYTLRLEVTDEGIHAQWFNSSGTLLGENSYSQAISNKSLGIWLRGGQTANTVYYIKELKVRSIATS